MNNTLPNGWTNTELETLFDFMIGGDWGKVPEFNDVEYTDVYCIRGTEYKNWITDKGKTAVHRKIKLSSLNKRKLKKGDILIEISGGGPTQPVGRTVVIDDQVLLHNKDLPKVCTNFIRLTRPSILINSYYLNYYLIKFYLTGDVIKYQGGSNNLRNLKFKDYIKIKIPIAPENEQIRIANKLDSILAKVQSAQAQLEKIPTLLKRFRQSVLAAATGGELTAEYRGEELFGRTVKIGDFSNNIRYGTSKKCTYDANGIPVLRIPNIGDNQIELDDLKYAQFNEKELINFKLEVDDLLIIRSNGSKELVGKTAIVKEKDTACLFAGYLIRIRFENKSKILPKYVLFALQSPQLRNVFEVGSRSTSGIHNINSKEIAALSFKLPSIEEQKEIVRRVENLFSFADHVEQQYQKAKTQVDKLTQSILSKAFRGELVPQDPNDKPAEKLLERIKANQNNLKTTKKKVAKKRLSNKKRQNKKSIAAIKGYAPIQTNNEKTVPKKNMNPKGINKVKDTLANSNKVLSGKNLMQKAGYPHDADSEQIEEFYLDLRKQINNKVITQIRIKETHEDFFVLTNKNE